MLTKALGELGHVPHGTEATDGDPEDGAGTRQGGLPRGLVGQLGLDHLAVVAQPVDRGGHDLPGFAEHPTGLVGKGGDDQVGEVAGQAHRLGIVGPGAQQAHGDRGAGLAGDASLEMVAPVGIDDERLIVLHTEAKGVGDHPHRPAQGPLDDDAPLRAGDGSAHLFEDLADVGRLHLALEVGMGGELVGEGLADEGAQPVGEGVDRRRAQVQVAVDGDEVLGDVEIGDDGVGRGCGDPVGLFEHRTETLAQGRALVVEHPPRRLPLDGGQVAGVIVEAVGAEHMVEHHQPAEIVLAALGQERRQPAHGVGAGARGREPFEPGAVIGRGTLLVEGEVDHDLPVAGGGEQLGIGDLARLDHIGEHQLDVAQRAPPPQPMVEPQRGGIADTEAFEEEATHGELAGPGVVGHQPLIEDDLGVHTAQLEGHRRVDGVLTNTKLTDIGGPALEPGQHDLAFGAGDRRGDGAVVEVSQPSGGEVAQRSDLGDEGGQQQRLGQAVIGPKGVRGRQGCHLVLREPVGGEQHGPQLGGIQRLGRVEQLAHGLVERVVAGGDHVVEVTDGDDGAELEVVAMVDEQLDEDLQRGAIALQGSRHGDERLHERRAEGIGVAEHGPVAIGGEQRVGQLWPQALRVGKCGVDLGPGGLVARPQHALFGDGGKVAVLQGDQGETAFLVAEDVTHRCVLVAQGVGADQLGQVALAGDEADDGHWPVGRGGLDELDELGRLPAHPA